MLAISCRPTYDVFQEPVRGSNQALYRSLNDEGSTAMAYRLDEYVSYGEVICTHHYGVTGFLVLRTEEGDGGGEHTFVRLDLTGLPDSDLIGKHICFEPEEGSQVKFFRREEHQGLKLMQIGATGTMTAQGWVRTLPCSVEEYEIRTKLGEPPPTEWKNHLYLEWFGPNGRVVVEMAGVLLERCIRERDFADETDVGDWEPLPNPVPRPEPYPHETTEFDGSTLEIHEICASGEFSTFTGADLMCEDGGLQRALDAEAAAIDRAIRSAMEDDEFEAEDDDDSQRFLEESRLMDECLERGEQTPFFELLGDLRALPRPEALGDQAVEDQLKIILGQLALLGVAYSVCDHCTPREAYRILIDQVLPDSGAYEELIGTDWVQHFMSHEYCAECDAEAERDYKKYAEESGEL